MPAARLATRLLAGEGGRGLPRQVDEGLPADIDHDAFDGTGGERPRPLAGIVVGNGLGSGAPDDQPAAARALTAAALILPVGLAGGRTLTIPCDQALSDLAGHVLRTARVLLSRNNGVAAPDPR
jgi:hypothetical protein